MSDIIITFFGHRQIAEKDVIEVELRKTLSVILSDAFDKSIKVIFLCGGYGEFDALCSLVIDDLRKQPNSPKIEKLLVTPYITEGYKERLDLMRPHYDDILYPELENVPPRYAISRRNEYMVDRADIVIGYVTRGWGGAATSLRYAYRKKKQVIRLVSNYELT